MCSENTSCMFSCFGYTNVKEYDDVKQTLVPGSFTDRACEDDVCMVHHSIDCSVCEKVTMPMHNYYQAYLVLRQRFRIRVLNITQEEIVIPAASTVSWILSSASSIRCSDPVRTPPIKFLKVPKKPCSTRYVVVSNAVNKRKYLMKA